MEAPKEKSECFACVERLREIRQKESLANKEEVKGREMLSKAAPDKSTVLCIKAQEGYILKGTINLMNEKEVSREELVLGTEKVTEIMLTKVFKELVLPDYKKWKAAKAPSAKENDFKSVLDANK
eukprot:TRINITY_DN13144_c0_g1_i4.p1 TRINITY_DN13144_c0_g1~~TRINITY_DN13144_c0_g1_i4.p1  ORF type:complete len:125 (+),score=32.32 TRINITY_DN13144_c0_g1_i4:486-860(+)